MRQENGSFSRRGSWRCTLESRTPLNVQLTSTVAVSHSLSFFFRNECVDHCVAIVALL